MCVCGFCVNDETTAHNSITELAKKQNKNKKAWMWVKGVTVTGGCMFLQIKAHWHTWLHTHTHKCILFLWIMASNSTSGSTSSSMVLKKKKQFKVFVCSSFIYWINECTSSVFSLL